MEALAGQATMAATPHTPRHQPMRWSAFCAALHLPEVRGELMRVFQIKRGTKKRGIDAKRKNKLLAAVREEVSSCTLFANALAACAQQPCCADLQC